MAGRKVGVQGFLGLAKGFAELPARNYTGLQ